jgi:hypothetical protein
LKFTKIKYNGEKVAISWLETKPGGTEIEHNLHSTMKPAPDLEASLERFSRFVEEILEVSHEWMGGLRVTGISINTEEEDGRAGLVITCQKKLALTNGPLVVNTPHLREPKNLGDDGPGFFLAGMDMAIDQAFTAATGFVQGKRAQREIFGDEVTLTTDTKRQLEILPPSKPTRPKRSK